MWVNNLPNFATQQNSGATRGSNRGPRVWIQDALTTKPLSLHKFTYLLIKICHVITIVMELSNSVVVRICLNVS